MISKGFQVALQVPTKVSVEQALGAGGVGFISRMVRPLPQITHHGVAMQTANAKNCIELRHPLQGAAACESEDDVVHVVSAICAAIFLLYLPIRLRELRTSSIKNVSGWRGLLKAVSTPPFKVPTHPRYGEWMLIQTIGYWDVVVHHPIGILGGTYNRIPIRITTGNDSRCLACSFLGCGVGPDSAFVA